MRFGIADETFESDDMYELPTASNLEPILYIPKTRNAVYIVRIDRLGVTVIKASRDQIAALFLQHGFPLLRQVMESLSNPAPIPALKNGAPRFVTDSTFLA